VGSLRHRLLRLEHGSTNDESSPYRAGRERLDAKIAAALAELGAVEAERLLGAVRDEWENTCAT
jgi:hypothetical protein